MKTRLSEDLKLAKLSNACRKFGSNLVSGSQARETWCRSLLGNLHLSVMPVDNLSVLGLCELVTGQALCKAGRIRQPASVSAVRGG